MGRKGGKKKNAEATTAVAPPAPPAAAKPEKKVKKAKKTKAPPPPEESAKAAKARRRAAREAHARRAEQERMAMLTISSSDEDASDFEEEEVVLDKFGNTIAKGARKVAQDDEASSGRKKGGKGNGKGKNGGNSASGAGGAGAGAGAGAGSARDRKVTIGTSRADMQAELDKLLAVEKKKGKLSNKQSRRAKFLRSQLDVVVAAKKEVVEDELGGFTITVAGKDVASAAAALGNIRDIHVEAFSISAPQKPLFVDAELRITHGRRYGLLGPNGMGKTTLLKVIAARKVPIPNHIDVLYVEQEVEGTDTPAYETVMRADKVRQGLNDEEAALLAETAKNEALMKGPDPEAAAAADERQQDVDARLSDVYDKLDALGNDDSEARARKILAGLGFTEEMQGRATKKFSGGWRMRISLARALFMQPTLLLLDEPTNHLDLNAVIWLEDYLQKYKHTVLVVSHDADFLSAICTDIVHLDNTKLQYYKGDYDTFCRMRDQVFEQKVKAYERQQKELKNAKKSGRSKKQAEADAKKKGGRRKGGAKADAAGNAEVKVQELLERPREYRVRFRFPEALELTPPVLGVHDVEFGYGDGPSIFKKVNFGIDTDSRVAIVGPNGVGKSTLLNLMVGLLDAREGEIRRNHALRVGRYNQHFVDVLPMDKSPVDFLRATDPDGALTTQDARRLLGRFGLGGHAHLIKIRKCSGGQKARVLFASLTLTKPHLLILDEPTNHLDLESIDALAKGLGEYNGGVVLVSHDARLIREANCELWVCANQDVQKFKGEFDDYRDQLLAELRRAEAEEDERARIRAEKRAAAKAKAVAEKEERIRKRLAAREAREKAAREAAGEDATATPPGGDAAPAAAAAPAPAE